MHLPVPSLPSGLSSRPYPSAAAARPARLCDVPPGLPPLPARHRSGPACPQPTAGTRPRAAPCLSRKTVQDKGPRPQGTLRAGLARSPSPLRGVRQVRKKQPPVRERSFPPVCAHRRVRLMTLLPVLRPAARKRSRCRLPTPLPCRPHGDAWVSFGPPQVWLRGRERQQQQPRRRRPLPVRIQEKK